MALPQQVRIAHGRFEKRAQKVEKAARARALVGVSDSELLELLLRPLQVASSK